jgi:cytochrome c-type biogenesis protein
MNEFTIVIAFTAGFVSFLSPCVLPLIPGFLAYLAGGTVSESGTNRLEIFLNSVFFVLGFSIIFAILGVLLNSVLSQSSYEIQLWLSRIGGVLIIFFGLYLVGAIKLSFLEKEHKFSVKKKFNSRYATSFIFGSAFAVQHYPYYFPIH